LGSPPSEFIEKEDEDGDEDKSSAERSAEMLAVLSSIEEKELEVSEFTIVELISIDWVIAVLRGWFELVM
jgi:hypothetical protein